MHHTRVGAPIDETATPARPDEPTGTHTVRSCARRRYRSTGRRSHPESPSSRPQNDRFAHHVGPTMPVDLGLRDSPARRHHQPTPAFYLKQYAEIAQIGSVSSTLPATQTPCSRTFRRRQAPRTATAATRQPTSPLHTHLERPTPKRPDPQAIRLPTSSEPPNKRGRVATRSGLCPPLRPSRDFRADRRPRQPRNMSDTFRFARSSAMHVTRIRGCDRAERKCRARRGRAVGDPRVPPAAM